MKSKPTKLVLKIVNKVKGKAKTTKPKLKEG